MRLGTVTDVHLNPAGTPAAAWHNPYHLDDAHERFAQVLQFCAAAGVDAIAVLGDLTHLGDAPSLRAGVELAAACGVPVWLVPGNHDVVQYPAALDDALATAGSAAVQLAGMEGQPVAGVRLAGLAELIGTPGWSARAARAPDPAAWGDALVVWLTHYPMLSLLERTRRHGLQYPGDLDNLPEVATPLVQRSAPTLVLHGHAHVRDAAVAGAMLQLSCAALIEPPFEVSILDVTFDGAQAAVRRTSTSIVAPPAVALPVLTSSEGSWIWTDGRWMAGPSTP